MKQGKVATLSDRGFGFIAIEGEEKELFFHSSELQNVSFEELKVGDVLSFEEAEGQKGKNAINVNKA